MSDRDLAAVGEDEARRADEVGVEAVRERAGRSERTASLLAQGRIGEALAHCRLALESGEMGLDEGEMRVHLAVALGLRGRLAEAQREFDQATRRWPPTADARLRWGRVWLARGRIDEAIDQFRQALQVDPQSADAHAQLADALRIRARLDDLTESAADRVARKPQHSQALFTLGMTLAARGRFVEAQETLLELLRLRPRFAEAHNNLGVVLSRLEMRSDARERYRKALEIKPDCAEASANLASLLDESRALAESLAHAIPHWSESNSNLESTGSSSGGFGSSNSANLEETPLDSFDWSGFDAPRARRHGWGSSLIPTTITLTVRRPGRP